MALSSFGQEHNPPSGPCNFSDFEKFCFKNSSNQTFGGSPLTLGCDYEVCVKIKPKPECSINCEMVLNPNGHWVETCFILAVGQQHCFNIPVPSKPITNCFIVEITMKVVTHSPTLVTNLQSDFPNVGLFKMIHKHCLPSATWYSTLERIAAGGSVDYNFNIITVGILGG